MIVRFFILAIVAFLPILASAQQPEDSLLPPDPATGGDTVITLSDSTGVVNSPDTAASDTASLDTLSFPGESDDSFEERYSRYRREHVERSPSLSCFDSLVTYFLSDRLDVGPQRTRSFHHDAGDYFRFDPSYFIVEDQVTPMRKTIQPFGLTGDRLNLVVDRLPIHPFDHTVEPDGLANMNDVPTASDDRLYLLPGPIGTLFGGHQAVASLVTLPSEPAGSEPESAILADEGSYDYSWVRGKYSRRFPGGKKMHLAAEYREAEGPTWERDDDAYHYMGDVYIPLSGSIGLSGLGYVFNRDGYQVIRPDIGGTAITRKRSDHQAHLSADWSTHDATARHEIGFTYQRHASYSTGDYGTHFDLIEEGGFLNTEWALGKTLIQARVAATYSEYIGWSTKYRSQGELTARAVRLNEGVSWAASVGGRYDEEHGYLPSVTLAAVRDTRSLYTMVSLGYCERGPTLHEQYLELRPRSIYGSGIDYADCGNEDLEKERQLVGNLIVELGPLENAIRVSVTGGRITDGIDWRNEIVTDGAETYRLFRPENGDIEFLDVSARKTVRLSQVLHLNAGGAYHNVEYGNLADAPYLPEYQAFSGLELHYFWPQALADLFAYGEIVYVGPYHGYDQPDLGDGAVVNAQLTLGLKDFRFHFTFQNVLSRAYCSREYIVSQGRYMYYGLVWNFLN